MPTVVSEITYEGQLAEKLALLKQQGNYRYFLPIKKSAHNHPTFDHITEGGKKTIVNWTSNDYLGMSVDTEVIAAFTDAAQQEGVGSGGTRNISGTTTQHRTLEKTIAQLHQKQTALLFTSAYVANSTAISTLARAFPNTLILSDEENHASMIEGVKLSRCEKRIFRHNDMAHLEFLLANTDFDRPKIILFESVYSMSGSIAPIESICELAKKYNALTYIDEVHGVGMYGAHGEGVTGEQNCLDKVDVINGTLAKSFGCVGGYVAANETIVDYIRSFGEGFIFTSSLPPALCAAATKSIEKVVENDRLRQHFHQNVKILRGSLLAENIAFEENASHITRIIIGDSKKTKEVTDRLFHDFGIYLQPINYPTVPKGREGLRIVVTARHTSAQIEHLAKALKRVL
ncbi:MAG: 5-aminolevulinate synthase [Saprospiraceae bacterium]|nr:5-aminolevulinate synthase [Saprospiraceae bacterium]